MEIKEITKLHSIECMFSHKITSFTWSQVKLHQPHITLVPFAEYFGVIFGVRE